MKLGNFEWMCQRGKMVKKWSKKKLKRNLKGCNQNTSCEHIRDSVCRWRENVETSNFFSLFLIKLKKLSGRLLQFRIALSAAFLARRRVVCNASTPLAPLLDLPHTECAVNFVFAVLRTDQRLFFI